ncbi:MAG: CBS domain-containing protein [Actinomycetota bacterium]|jgi:signal-transduction protein with cAMP-binding, CBS, and nucleotidyltransferase domain
MQAKKAIRKPPATIPSGTSMADAARLMDRRVVGALVALNGDRPIGIVTDRDLAVRRLGRRLPGEASVDRVMTTELVTLPAGAYLREAIKVFYRHPFRRLPLMEDGPMVGMLTVDDLVIDFVSDSRRKATARTVPKVPARKVG